MSGTTVLYMYDRLICEPNPEILTAQWDLLQSRI